MVQLLSLGERAVKLALKWGATEAEAYLSRTVQNYLSFHEKIESGKASQLTGIGVRAIVDKRIGFASSSSAESRSIENAAKTAVSIAKASQADPNWPSFPKRTGRAKVVGTFDKRTSEIETDTLVRKAVEIIDFVLDRDSRLAPVRGSLTTGTVNCAIVNSHGSELSKRGTYAAFSIRVKAEDAGKKGTSDEGWQARSWREIEFEKLTEDASQRAIKMLDASPIPNTKASVIFASDLFAQILNVMFTRTINAEAVQKGRSPWIGKIGQRIAHDNFDVIDNGIMRGGFMTWGFDDEGVPQQLTPIIQRGMLKSYLYDTYTGAKDKVGSTGNATRRGMGMFGLADPYTRTPTPAPTNFILKPGDAKRDELIEETQDGLYVVTSIGEWLSNPMSGMLNATVTNAFLVKKGELSNPVKGVIVSGNFFDMMRNTIDLIADDVRNAANFYSPSVRVREMSIAGR